jgi:hypothetical protein
MGSRIGASFRLGRHVYVGISVPLGHHGRRLAAHRGHGDPINFLVGCMIMLENRPGPRQPIRLVAWSRLRWPGCTRSHRTAQLCGGSD